MYPTPTLTPHYSVQAVESTKSVDDALQKIRDSFTQLESSKNIFIILHALFVWKKESLQNENKYDKKVHLLLMQLVSFHIFPLIRLRSTNSL